MSAEEPYDIVCHNHPVQTAFATRQRTFAKPRTLGITAIARALVKILTARLNLGQTWSAQTSWS